MIWNMKRMSLSPYNLRVQRPVIPSEENDGIYKQTSLADASRDVTPVWDGSDRTL